MFESPKKFQTTSKSDFTSFYIGLLIFHEVKISVIFIADQSDSFPKKCQKKKNWKELRSNLDYKENLMEDPK